MVDQRTFKYPDPGMATALVDGEFCASPNTTAMTTIGKRYLQRTKHPEEQGRILDSHTRTVLNAVLQAGRGHTLDAYLRAVKGRTER